MKLVREMVRKFFEDYERGVNASDHELLSAKYNDLFVFVSPHGVQVIKKDDFVKVLPKRHGFLRTVGLLEPRDGRAANVRTSIRRHDEHESGLFHGFHGSQPVTKPSPKCDNRRLFCLRGLFRCHALNHWKQRDYNKTSADFAYTD
jgi:hypothetical protein